MSRFGRYPPLGLALVALAVCACLAAPSEGQDTETQQAAIDAARESLADGENPWYDPSTDSLRVIPTETVDRNPPRWSQNLGLGRILKGLAYGLLGSALAALVALLIWFAINQSRSRRSTKVATTDVPLHVDVEALPFLAERPRDDLLGRARRHYTEGNYSEAIIYLFSYQLVELDKHACIHLAKGKTNRQYLRELAARPLRGILERTLVAFEGVFFGSRELERAAFEACWNELPQFQNQLQVAP